MWFWGFNGLRLEVRGWRLIFRVFKPPTSNLQPPKAMASNLKLEHQTLNPEP
jgi:hypothetical protein